MHNQLNYQPLLGNITISWQWHNGTANEYELHEFHSFGPLAPFPEFVCPRSKHEGSDKSSNKQRHKQTTSRTRQLQTNTELIVRQTERWIVAQKETVTDLPTYVRQENLCDKVSPTHQSLLSFYINFMVLSASYFTVFSPDSHTLAFCPRTEANFMAQNSHKLHAHKQKSPNVKCSKSNKKMEYAPTKNKT